MSLLRQIQDEAMADDSSVASLLRRCLVLAQRLGHQPLRAWAESELNGYEDVASLPPYRRLESCRVLGQFTGYRVQSATLQLRQTDGAPDWLFSAELVQPVAAYEALLASDENSFQMPWPPEAVHLYGQGSYTQVSCHAAHKAIDRSQIAAVLDQIKSRVLSFCLAIELSNPDAGEAAVGSQPVPPEVVSQAFTTNIYGGQVTVANSIGGDVVANSGVSVGDLDSLLSALRALGLPGNELDDLRDALEEDGQQSEGLGPNAARWVGNLATKAAQGTLAVSNNATVGGAAAGLILYYLGLT